MITSHAPISQLVAKHIKALIFDLDGTLADTMPLHWKVWQEALGEAGPLFTESMFYETAGMPAERLVEFLTDRLQVEIPVGVAAAKEIAFAQALNSVTPVQAVYDLAMEFRDKLPMAVATGGTRENCDRTLRLLGGTDWFGATVTADDVTKGKPDPEVFLKAADALGVEPTECLVFEDGDLGIEAARAAGMEVVDVRPYYQRSAE